MKKLYFILVFILVTINVTNAQVGIGTIMPGSTLDVTAFNPTGAFTNVDGILIPRVTRQRAQNMLTIPISTLIYVNEVVTGSAFGITSNVTTVGFYFFNGIAWEKVASGASNDWALTGNSGTVAGTNFIGTNDAIDFRIKTGNTDRWNFSNSNAGQLQPYSLGTAALPIYSFQTDTNTGLFSSGADALDLSTGGTARLRIPNANQIHALNLGTAALPFYSFSTDSNTGIFSSGADALDLSTGGIARFRIPNTDQVHALSLGTAALPFYSFSADSNTGIYSPIADNLSIATNGTEKLRVISTGQVGIGTPGPNGALDVTSTTDGILIPRVALSATNVATVSTPTISEIVYNTFTSAVGPNQVTPGFYYWNGIIWVKFATGNNNNDWALTGNAGTIAGTNYIGTSDAIDLRIKTGGTDRWNISNVNNGQLQSYSLGLPTIPSYSFNGDSNTGIYSAGVDILNFSTNGLERARINATGQTMINSTAAFATSTLYSAATGNNNAVDGNSAGTGTSIYGQNTNSGNGVYGINNSTGKGVRGTTLGSGHGVWGMHQNLTLTGIAVYGESFYGNGYSFKGLDGPIYSDNTFFGSDALIGETDDLISNALWGKNFNVDGTAILGGVNGVYVFNTGGSGLAGSSEKLGVFAYGGLGDNNNANRGNAAGKFTLDSDSDPSTNAVGNGNRASAIIAGFDDISYTNTTGGTGAAQNSYFGGYFSGGNEASGTTSYAYAGLRYNTNPNGTTGTDFKIVGPGSNSTIIMDKNNTPRILFSPEAPEIVFQDFGVGKLNNGQTNIELDPILKESLLIDAKHPLKVYVTLEDECNGVFVTNKSDNGFTVKELKGGTSNASFSWQIVANRADTKDLSGNITSKHVDVRLPIGPGPLKIKATAKPKDNNLKTVNSKNKASNKANLEKIQTIQETDNLEVKK